MRIHGKKKKRNRKEAKIFRKTKLAVDSCNTLHSYSRCRMFDTNVRAIPNSLQSHHS